MDQRVMNERFLQIGRRVESLQRETRKSPGLFIWLGKVCVFIEAAWLIVIGARNKNNSKFVVDGSTVTGLANIDKCLVLSLERRGDRREFMQKQLEREGITYSFLDAVDGQLLKTELLPESLISKTSKENLSNGQFGCALSHYDIWLQMLEKGWDNLLLFEDDTVIDENFKAKLEIVMKEVPDDFDYLILGSCGKIFERERVSKHVFVPYNTCCTDGYIVSKAGAEKLLTLAAPMDLKLGGIDIVISELIKRKKINAYHLDPLLCGQQDLFDTDINKGS